VALQRAGFLAGRRGSLFLVLALVVRLGVRAWEIELDQYWQLFSSMAEPIFICDADGKIRLGDPALVRALGRQSSHEITGKPWQTLSKGRLSRPTC